MKILFIEETDTISVTVPIILRKHGLSPNNIRWCRTPSHALPILENETFDGIICASQFSHGEYGPRFLSEMYLSDLIKPSSVILLFYESPKDLQVWMRPPLCHTMALERPFNTKNLEESIGELYTWLNNAEPLYTLLENKAFTDAIYLIEDLQLVHPNWQESLDRMKGYLLLQKQEYQWALQHYQQCSEEYNTNWVHRGMCLSLLWLERSQEALEYTETLDPKENAISYNENHFVIDLTLRRYKECHKYIDQLLLQTPWQHEWHEWATLLQILMHNYEEALKYATEDHSHQLRRTTIRQHLKRFQLHAILVMSSTFPNPQARRRIYHEWKELEQALVPVVSTQEQLLFKAQTDCLNMKFEQARQSLNKLGNIDPALSVHTLLYGWSVCWLTALPKHAQEFIHALELKLENERGDYVTYHLDKFIKSYMNRNSKQRLEHIKELHMRRNLAITEKNYPSALKYSIELFHYYPAFPGDSLITIELLAVAWPPNLSSKEVETILNQLCTIVQSDKELDDAQKERFQKAEKRARKKIQYRFANPS